MKFRSRKGQSAAEYVLAFAALIVVASAMYALTAAAVRSAHRTVGFARQDFP